MPLKVIITQGTTGDCGQAEALIESVEGDALLADRAYDTNKIIELCASKGMEAVIPSKKNRKEPRHFDKELYKLRHLVENAFLHLKQWRGIATLYAKNTASFLAAVQIRCVFLWLQIL